jgi:hypothetical protein
MPVRELFYKTFIGKVLHRKSKTIRGWICANVAHSWRQNGVLGVSVIVAHPWTAPGRGRSPELPAEHGAFALGGTASVLSDLFSIRVTGKNGTARRPSLPDNGRFGDPIRSDPICGFN